MPIGSFKYDDAIATGAAFEPRQIFAAGALDEDLNDLTDERTAFLGAELVDEGEQLGVPFIDEGLGDLVRHAGGGSVLAFGVFENEGIIEPDLPREGESVLEVGIGFAGESDDDIGGDADARLGLAEVVDDLEKPLAGIAAVHQFEHSIAAALNGDMGAFAEFGQPGVGFDEIRAVAFGVRGRKSDPLELVDLMDGFEKLNERRKAIARRDIAFSVTGDDLAEQSNFPNAALGQVLAFGDDFRNGPAAFGPARVGNDAEGAMLIAALHDADKSGDRFLLGIPRQQMLLDGAFAALFLGDVDNFFLPASENGIEVFSGAMEFLRADDQVDIGQLIDQALTAALGHAAHKTEDDVRAMPADVRGQVLHFADGFFFSGIADAAGIEQNDVGGGF